MNIKLVVILLLHKQIKFMQLLQVVAMYNLLTIKQYKMALLYKVNLLYSYVRMS